MLWRALKHVESGFYIDVGANDPTLDSVTKAFYARCWHGINIEPTVFYFERLAHERPADINLRVAAGAERGTLTLHEVAQTGLSTTQPDVAAQHRREGYDVLCHEVETLPLDEICATHVTGDIHFLKIDVEGGEHDVLRGLDLARWRPWILVIEATRPMSQDETYQEWEPILLSHRYGFAYADGLNRFYVADEHPELMPAFRYPPNVFDGFSSNTHEASVMRMQESDVRALRSRQALLGEMARTKAAEDRAVALDRELTGQRERVRELGDEAQRHAEERATWIQRHADEMAAETRRHSEERTAWIQRHADERATWVRTREDDSKTWAKRHSDEGKAWTKRLVEQRTELEARALERQLVLEAELRAATALIEAMRASTSWRLSAPVRWARRALGGGIRFPMRIARGLRRRLSEASRRELRPVGHETRSHPLAEPPTRKEFHAQRARNAAPDSPASVAEAIRAEISDWRRASAPSKH